ncbi:MAG: putative sulfate exporter family transporter [Planctomycetes bacterium]|nr:putative sulfate exporter family transporter [Planctomycetota bacterium]
MLPRPPQFPGLAWAAALGLGCHFATPLLRENIEGWALGGVSLAILLGFLLGQIIAPTTRTKPGLKYAEKTVLAVAIGFLGARLDGGALAELGWPTAWLLLAMMLLTIVAGRVFAYLCGLGPGMGWALGVGTAVCGSSAIAATAPFVDAKEEEVGLSVGVVNLLGTIGIFALPAIIFLMSSPEEEAIVMTGGSLHAVGHVVAAGYTVSEEVGIGATAVKMGRIALLVPTVLFLALRQQKRREKGDAAASQGIHKLLPGYLIAFVTLATMNTLGWLPNSVGDVLAELAQITMAIAMAGIGLQLQLRVLIQQGPSTLLAGTLCWVLQIGFLFAGMRLL